MSILDVEITGPVKPLVISLLAGIALGAIGGSIYGNALEQREMQAEMQRIHDGRVNYRSNDGLPISKVADSIRSQARTDGLWVGIPLGTIFGIVVGIGYAFAVSLARRDPTKLRPKRSPH